jgi:hypothetical protein
MVPAAFRGEGIPVKQSGAPRLGLIAGAGQHKRTDTGTTLYHLCVLDLDRQDYPLTLIRMNFFGHGIVADPVNPELVSIFEKRGRGACEIDLKQGRVTRPITTAPNRQFYGHGAYSQNGDILYSTETVMEEGCTGLIAVRDAKTHKYLGEFPSYGASPHDCRLIDNGNTMVITNGGGNLSGAAPGVAFVDIHSEKLIEKLEFDTPDINAGHLDITSDGGLAVVSAQREGFPDMANGGISLKPRKGDLHTLDEPEDIVQRLQGETLSVCIHETSGVVGATTPAGNLLTFWDLDSGKLLRHVELQNPRGIELSRDGAHFVVSYGFGAPPEALCLFSADSLERIPGYDIAATGITGSHLFSYTLPAGMRD